MPHLLAGGGQASGADDDGQIVNGPCKVLIHNNIIEFSAVTHLLARSLEALLDDTRRVLRALRQPLA